MKMMLEQKVLERRIEYRFYRTFIPIFAEGNVSSHVIDRITEDPSGDGLMIKTQCGRALNYTHTNGFDRARNAFVVNYRKGVLKRRVAFSCDANGYVLRMNRCTLCSFNTKDSAQYAKLNAKHVAVSTIIDCIAGSELEQFVLSQPCERLA
jgi:hypothetical protein